MNSIGASSRSPSPITTVPSIGSLLSSRRMASTAAWSAAFSSPRPRSRAADTAARSVTRTISSERMRSSTWFGLDGDRRRHVAPLCRPCADVRLPVRVLSVFLDADHLRLARKSPCRALTAASALAHRILGGRIGDQDDRHRTRSRPWHRRRPAVAPCDGAARSIPARSPAPRAAWRWSRRCPACRRASRRM